MPNQWEHLLAGVIQGGFNYFTESQKRSQRDEAEETYKLYRDKLVKDWKSYDEMNKQMLTNGFKAVVGTGTSNDKDRSLGAAPEIPFGKEQSANDPQEMLNKLLGNLDEGILNLQKNPYGGAYSEQLIRQYERMLGQVQPPEYSIRELNGGLYAINPKTLEAKEIIKREEKKPSAKNLELFTDEEGNPFLGQRVFDANTNEWKIEFREKLNPEEMREYQVRLSRDNKTLQRGGQGQGKAITRFDTGTGETVIAHKGRHYIFDGKGGVTEISPNGGSGQGGDNPRNDLYWNSKEYEGGSSQKAMQSDRDYEKDMKNQTRVDKRLGQTPYVAEEESAQQELLPDLTPEQIQREPQEQFATQKPVTTEVPADYKEQAEKTKEMYSVDEFGRQVKSINEDLTKTRTEGFEKDFSEGRVIDGIANFGNWLIKGASLPFSYLDSGMKTLDPSTNIAADITSLPFHLLSEMPDNVKNGIVTALIPGFGGIIANNPDSKAVKEFRDNLLQVGLGIVSSKILKSKAPIKPENITPELIRAGILETPEAKKIIDSVAETIKQKAPENLNKAGEKKVDIVLQKYKEYPTIELSGKEYTGITDKRRLISKVKEYLSGFLDKELPNDHTGKVIKIDKTGIKKTTSQKQIDQLEAIYNFPDMIKNMKLVESVDDNRKRNAFIKIHRFGVNVKKGNSDYTVIITVREKKNGDFFYDGAAVNQELFK